MCVAVMKWRLMKCAGDCVAVDGVLLCVLRGVLQLIAWQWMVWCLCSVKVS